MFEEVVEYRPGKIQNCEENRELGNLQLLFDGVVE
jgi:hypothetical protein